MGDSQECQGQVAAVSQLRSGMTGRSQKAARSNHWALVLICHFPLNMKSFPCPGSRAGVMISCSAVLSPRVLPVCLAPWLFLQRLGFPERLFIVLAVSPSVQLINRVCAFKRHLYFIAFWPFSYRPESFLAVLAVLLL